LEKGGFVEALQAAGIGAKEAVVFADERRAGLMGQVRRQWRAKGEKIRQRVARRYVWRGWM
jgi:hypothetical protein